MGLFLTAEGRFQGWLAALLCCCAVDQDESPYEIERERARAVSRPQQTCNIQPPALAELPATPVPSTRLQRKTSDDGIENTRSDRHLLARPPSLKPLDLGESSLLSRQPQHGKKRASFGHATRPSISAPHSFRRLDTPEPQRQSLIPLRLGPVVLTQSSVPLAESPDTRAMMDGERSDSTQDLLPETPYERCWAHSSFVQSPTSSEPPAKVLKRSASTEDPRLIRRSMSTKRSSTSLHREVPSATLFPPREPVDRPLLRRKSSFQLRKPFVESGDIDTDKEVLELNTIVEERRAEAARAEKHGSQHIPAIAPHMQVHARSETLEAIGSALGRPRTAQANHRVPTPLQQTRSRPSMRRSTSAGSRVSGWLSGMMGPHSVAHLPGSEHFYKCQAQTAPALHRSRSETSDGTGVTEEGDDSPSLTAASSPTSKGHSRSHTGESPVTPVSPSYAYGGGGGYGGYEGGMKVVELPWPTSSTSAVGLAL